MYVNVRTDSVKAAVGRFVVGTPRLRPACAFNVHDERTLAFRRVMPNNLFEGPFLNGIRALLMINNLIPSSRLCISCDGALRTL
jgi:hypothetical protein